MLEEYRLEDPEPAPDGVLETNVSEKCRSRSIFFGRSFRCQKRGGHDGHHMVWDDGIMLTWDGEGGYSIQEWH